MTDKRVQSPRWLSLAIQLLDGAADSHRSQKSNSDTIRHTKAYIKILLDGLPLSDAQSKTFVENIKNRIPGKKEFEWDGQQIKLTTKQVTDAKTNPRYQAIVQEFHEVNTWKSHLHAVLDSKLREMEAGCKDVEEYQALIARMYDDIKAYEW